MKLRTIHITLLIAVLLLVGCGVSSTSPLVAALEDISTVADVASPVIAAFSPEAAGFVALIPAAVTAALDIVEGKTPVAAAGTVASQLQAVLTQGASLLPSLSAVDKTIVSAIMGAVKAGLNLYQQSYPAVTSQQFQRGYAMGFFDSPSPTKAKVAKLSKKDKAAAARARAHIEALKAKLAAGKK